MGHKKVRNHSQKRRTKADTVVDVALADFADANVPRGSGRVRKSKSNLPLGPPIEDEGEDDDIDTVLAQKADSLSLKTESNAAVEDNSNDVGLLLADELWILLSEYMRPQDVLNFSLICKSSYRIVNSPLFWIKLYKRYYSTKVYVPTFLKKHCLERHLGLKAKVVRSLYYTYPPYHESLRRPVFQLTGLIGYRCELMWVQRARDKETNNTSQTEPTVEKWIYSFKLSCRPDHSYHNPQSKRKTKQDIINHNPDDTCRLLEVICKEYVDPKFVVGMKLRKANIEDRCVQLKFSSAPLSRFGTDFGAIDIYLNAVQPPSIYAWWHPHFYNQRF
ncbi:hypothetical protein GE061_019278 [Apolygus lucorum]|uniref:F-box domain-containing protein n=1 Tax=Apolygus lucorum TaxID=248454 RepID=A0A6A4JJA8_APOLU|nr:hypothetical protein GE061_019278 [Apolygus lucorum]